MKVTIISDWHGNFNLFSVPESDVICICGDMMCNNSTHKYEKWLSTLPAKLVLVVPGNHDIPLKHEMWEPPCNNKVFNPIRQPVKYQGITFGGFCWSFTESIEMAAYWSFMTTDRARIKQRMTNVPACDVLITHSPPSCREMLIKNNMDIGVPNMIDWVLDNNCKHIFCGHIHEHGGTVHNVAGVQVVNAALSMIQYSL